MRRLLILIPLLFTGCAPFMSYRSAEDPPARISLQGVRELSVSEARPLLQQGVTVLDVRTPREFQDGHLPGARNLPLQSLASWAPELATEGTYLVICRSGARSTRAVQALEARGFRNLLNVSGGMLAWQEQGFPVERP